MFTVDDILSLDKAEIPEVSKTILPEDLTLLIDLLNEKDDKLRYQSLLLLQYRSQYSGDVYPFWDIFTSKLKSNNSYQRSIGLMLIADNVKWDTADRMKETIKDYLELIKDEKPITVRQCIQALSHIVTEKQELSNMIAEQLMALNLLNIKETMRKLILVDILNVLIMIKKNNTTIEIENYITNALTGGILDNKAKKQLEAMM